MTPPHPLLPFADCAYRRHVARPGTYHGEPVEFHTAEPCFGTDCPVCRRVPDADQARALAYLVSRVPKGAVFET